MGNMEMNIGIPFVSISAIAYNCSPTNSTGNSLVIGTDVYLRPQNYATRGLPIEMLEFIAPIYGDQDSIKITGVVGSYSTWPADAWHGVLFGACSILGEAIGANQFGGATTVKDDDQTQSSEANPFASIMGVWKSKFDTAVSEYTLIRRAE